MNLPNHFRDPEKVKRRGTMEEHRIKMDRKILEYLPHAPTAMYDIGVGPKLEWQRLKNTTGLEGMQLYGCEPDPRTYQWLKPQFPGTLWQVAIAYKETKVLRLYQYERWMITSQFERHNRSIGSVDVPCWTLDYFDEQCGKPNNILLWMDIEGMEYEALRSGESLLQSKRIIAINLECRQVPLAEGWALEDELTDHLYFMGYDLVKQYNNQRTHWDNIYLRRLSRP